MYYGPIVYPSLDVNTAPQLAQASWRCDKTYRIAGNFHWVLIFAISRTVYGVAKIKIAIIYLTEIYSVKFNIDLLGIQTYQVCLLFARCVCLTMQHKPCLTDILS